MGEAARFYWLWVRGTVWSAPGAADGYAGLIGTALGIASHYLPETQQMTEGWLWQLPIWLLGAIIVVRFLVTPFTLWRASDGPLRGFRDRLAANRERAYHAARYIEALAQEIAAGEWPQIDESAFKVCMTEIERTLASDLPRDLVEPFQDLAYVTDRMRHLVIEGSGKAEIADLAQRARSNLNRIDAALV